MSTPTVAAVDASAAAALAELHRLSFERSWSAESLHGLLRGPGAFALGADWEGTAAGFILCRSAAAEAEIITLAVRPETRRHGVGAALVAEALRHACREGVKTMHLEVAADNAAALALYRHCGFAETGRRAGYYAPQPGGSARIDAVLMARAAG